MASGLRIWDAAGMQILDTNDIVSRCLGTINVTAANLSGSISVPAFATGQPFFLIHSPRVWWINSILTMLVTISGTTLTWTTGAPFDLNGATILYGVGKR